ncbi:MAG TPA: hypothetical protein VLX31_01880 [Streptosporangiaceae bacterium]|nr:hypothetical protein [Streptosporangiaceae bacterium]
MSIIVGDDGQLHAEPDDSDPIQRTNARIIDLLAWKLELDRQTMDAFDVQHEQAKARVTELESTVAALRAQLAVIEQLVIG